MKNIKEKIEEFYWEHTGVSIIIILAVVITIFLIIFSQTASFSRLVTDIKSEFSNGLDREITIYTAMGEELAHYEGKIDIEANEGGYVKFDFEGKRYIYYNCFVETIAEIE